VVAAVEVTEEAFGLGEYGRVLTILTCGQLPSSEARRADREESFGKKGDWREALRTYAWDRYEDVEDSQTEGPLSTLIKHVRAAAVGRLQVVHVVLSGDADPQDPWSVTNQVSALPECQPLFLLLLTESCRGVAIDCLDAVLEGGIDVRPTTAPIWVSSMDKAMEYGGFPKLLLLLDNGCLQQTFRELSDDSPTEHQEELRRTYQTETRSPDGEKKWFSRLPESDRRLATGYEVAYARWIPGDAKRALQGLIIIEHPAVAEPMSWQALSTRLSRWRES